MEEKNVIDNNMIEMHNVHYFENVNLKDSYSDSDSDSDSDSESNNYTYNDNNNNKNNDNSNVDTEKDQLKINEDNNNCIRLYNEEGIQIYNPNLPIGNNIILKNGYHNYLNY